MRCLLKNPHLSEDPCRYSLLRAPQAHSLERIHFPVNAIGRLENLTESTLANFVVDCVIA
jgi:hypothetical protein